MVDLSFIAWPNIFSPWPVAERSVPSTLSLFIWSILAAKIVTTWMNSGGVNLFHVGKRAVRWSEQKGERGLARLLRLQRQEGVGAGSTEIDRGHRFSSAGRPLDEAEARIDHERGADDQHGVGFIEMPRGRIDPVARNVLAEKHHIRLEHAAAAPAGRHVKGREIGAVEVCVAVGRFRCVQIEPVGVQPAEVVLQLFAGRSQLAIHAADKIDPAVQVDHPRVAGRLMQPVDVLGENELDSAHRLEPGQGAMSVVRPRLANAPPAAEAARPIAPTGLFVAHEGLEGHRLRALPLAVGVAIVGNARAGAAPGAGQDEQTPMPVDKVLETAGFDHERRLSPKRQSRHQPFQGYRVLLELTPTWTEPGRTVTLAGKLQRKRPWATASGRRAGWVDGSCAGRSSPSRWAPLAAWGRGRMTRAISASPMISPIRRATASRRTCSTASSWR